MAECCHPTADMDAAAESHAEHGTIDDLAVGNKLQQLEPASNRRVRRAER